jgi:hypothetical protein
MGGNYHADYKNMSISVYSTITAEQIDSGATYRRATNIL